MISAAYCSAGWLIWFSGWLTDWLVGWLVGWCHFFSELKTRTRQSLVHARQVLNYPATPPDLLTLKNVRFFAEEALWPASASSNTSTVCSSKQLPALCTCSLHYRVTSTQCNNQHCLFSHRNECSLALNPTKPDTVPGISQVLLTRAAVLTRKGAEMYYTLLLVGGLYRG